MKGFSTVHEFYSQSKDIQHAFIFGWALGILHANEDMDSDAECCISKVRDIDDKTGFFGIQYEWKAGVKEAHDTIEGNYIDESEPIFESEEFWVHFSDLDKSVFDFHNELLKVKFDEEYSG